MEENLSDVISFGQVRINVARFATDDFNLWHDPRRYNQIQDNPFGVPICLGFQLEQLLEYLVIKKRTENEQALVAEKGYYFSNYEINFVNAIRSDEQVSFEVRKTTVRNSSISNRLIVKAGRKDLKIMGKKIDAANPLCCPDADFSRLNGQLTDSKDMDYVEGTKLWLKRKWLGTGNAKTFLEGSRVDPSYYFDEIEDRVRFPEIFPVALVSGALMQKGLADNYDFRAEPLVYTGHCISVDKRLVKGLASNSRVHILIAESYKHNGSKGLTEQVYPCYGLLDDKSILFRAELRLATLSEVLSTKKLK